MVLSRRARRIHQICEQIVTYFDFDKNKNQSDRQRFKDSLFFLIKYLLLFNKIRLLLLSMFRPITRSQTTRPLTLLSSLSTSNPLHSASVQPMDDLEKQTMYSDPVLVLEYDQTIKWLEDLDRRNILNKDDICQNVGVPLAHIVEKLSEHVLNPIHHRKVRSYIQDIWDMSQEMQNNNNTVLPEVHPKPNPGIPNPGIPIVDLPHNDTQTTYSKILNNNNNNVCQQQQHFPQHFPPQLVNYYHPHHPDLVSVQQAQQPQFLLQSIAPPIAMTPPIGEVKKKRPYTKRNLDPPTVNCPVLQMGYSNVECEHSGQIKKACLVDHLASHIATLMKHVRELENRVEILENGGKAPCISLD